MNAIYIMFNMDGIRYFPSLAVSTTAKVQLGGFSIGGQGPEQRERRKKLEEASEAVTKKGNRLDLPCVWLALDDGDHNATDRTFSLKKFPAAYFRFLTVE
jgi:hypothetical protein